LFAFPKAGLLRDKWVEIVVTHDTVPSDFQPDSESCVCNKHFQEIDFSNYGQYQLKLASRLSLVSSAVPIENTARSERQHLSDCQSAENERKRRKICSQESKETQCNFYVQDAVTRRTIGTQARIMCKTIGTQTTHIGE
jgi:hypothetical protein